MDTRPILAGTVLLLLLFGCTGPSGPSGKAGGGTGGAAQVAQGLGDSNIDVTGPVNDTDLLPTVGGVEAGEAVVPVSSASISALDSEVDVTQVNDTDLLVTVDGIEQG